MKVIPTTPPYDGKSTRPASTMIEFLLEKGHFSIWHTQKFDETWTYSFGDPILILIVHRDGKHEEIKLGNPDIHPGFQLHYTVKSDGLPYIAAEVAKVPVEIEAEYFFGTAQVAPGFDFEDTNFNVADEMLAKFPQHQELIKRLRSN